MINYKDPYSTTSYYGKYPVGSFRGSFRDIAQPLVFFLDFPCDFGDPTSGISLP